MRTSLGRGSFVSSILFPTVVLTLACGVLEGAARADVDASLLLHQAMKSRVTVHKNRRSGRTIPAVHCRRAVEGCEQRLNQFAGYLVDAGTRNGIDPWLLAAMAFRESGMNPFAVGDVGELGILQLHPKNPRVKSVRFVSDAWYRERCRKQVGACQREVVDRAAEILARSIAKCNGDVNLALGLYNTGKCGGNSRYALKIMAVRNALRGSVGLAPDTLAALSDTTIDRKAHVKADSDRWSADAPRARSRRSSTSRAR
jgi:Transglycosylase SLT domain